MIFLAPSTAILGAAIGATLLVLLYILKLLRRPLRVSSVKFWPAPADDSQVNTPFRRFRPSLLFFLHALLIALAVFALGRPAITLDAPGGERVVLLLDTSASMAAIDPGSDASRLDRARARARALVASITRSGRRSVCIIPFAVSAQAATAFTTSRAAANAAIDAARQTDQPGDLGAALELAGALLGEGEQNASASIILLSDGTFGPRTDTSAAPLGSPRPLVFERIGPGSDAPVNAGVVSFAARRDANDPAQVRIFAEVSLTATAPATIAFTLALNGDPVLTRSADAGPPGAPRNISLPLTLRTSDGGVLTLVLGSPDALAADNAASLTLARPTSPRVALVQPRGPTVAGATPADWLLSDVLEELRPASLRRISAQELSTAPPTGADTDLIVLDRAGNARLPAVASLSFGDSVELAGVRVDQRPEPLVTPVVVWSREHPALAGLSLDALVAEQRVKLTIAEGAPVEVLASGKDGPLIVAGTDRGVRRIFAAFELARSNWPLLPEFPVFVAAAADALTLKAESSAGVASTTAAPLRVEAAGAGEVTASGPAELRATAAAQGPVSLGVPERAGVYTIAGAKPALAPVNLVDATESSLASAGEITVGRAVLPATGVSRAQQELWPYAAMALAGLLMLEWFIFGVRARQ